MQVRGKRSNGRTVEKWSDSGFNLKVEPTGLAHGFSVGCLRERKGKCLEF